MSTLDNKVISYNTSIAKLYYIIIKHVFFFILKSYLMGCAFNMYSSSWSDRSYGLTLFFYCWIFPLLIIFCSYIGIIYHTRISGEKILISSTAGRKSEIDKETTKGRKQNGSLNKNSSHSPQRVSLNIINKNNRYLYLTMVYS